MLIVTGVVNATAFPHFPKVSSAGLALAAISVSISLFFFSQQRFTAGAIRTLRVVHARHRVNHKNEDQKAPCWGSVTTVEEIYCGSSKREAGFYIHRVLCYVL